MTFDLVSSRAVLTFADPSGAKASFSIPRAKPSVGAAEAEAFMDAMVQSGALAFSNLSAVSDAVGAKLVQTSRRVLV